MSWEVEDIIGLDERKRKLAIDAIYENCFPQIKAFVLNNGGSIDDALDVFQDGVTSLYQSLKKNSFRKNSKVSTYLYSICRNLWYAKFKDYVRDKELTSVQDSEKVSYDFNLLRSTLNELKPDCVKVLVGFYYQRKSMSELQTDLNLGSEQAAKNKKYKCLKYLMALIEKRGLTFTSFIVEE